jgi:hypothetical protein
VVAEYRARGRDQLVIPKPGSVELEALGNTTKPKKPYRFEDKPANRPIKKRPVKNGAQKL